MYLTIQANILIYECFGVFLEVISQEIHEFDVKLDGMSAKF